MRAQKDGGHGDKDDFRSSVSNVYEIAVASAREAKRINRRFSVANQLPSIDIVRTAIRKVVGGDVAYSVEIEDQVSGELAGKGVSGHS